VSDVLFAVIRRGPRPSASADVPAIEFIQREGDAEGGRLSLSECRRLLPGDCDLTDADVMRLRDAFYEQAEVMLDVEAERRGRLRPRQ
jgi:hypothetical protein